MAKYDELVNVFKSYFYDATEEFSVPLLASSGSFSPEDRKKLDELLQKQSTIFSTSLEHVKEVVSSLNEAGLNHDQILNLVRKSDLVKRDEKALEAVSNKTVAPTSTEVVATPAAETVAPAVEAETVNSPATEVTAAPAVTEAVVAPEQPKEPVVEKATQEVPVAQEATVQEVKVPGESVALEESAQPFTLSPMDEGVVSAESSAQAEISRANEALKNVQTAMSQVSADQTLSRDTRLSSLKELNRVAQQAVRAIMVARSQLDRLYQSRSSQEQLLADSFSNGPAVASASMPQAQNPSGEVVAQPAQTVQQVTAPAPSVQPAIDAANKEQAMQDMLAQANQLYGQGKTDEAAQVLGQVSAMNRESQGTAYVKKPE